MATAVVDSEPISKVVVDTDAGFPLFFFGCPCVLPERIDGAVGHSFRCAQILVCKDAESLGRVVFFGADVGTAFLAKIGESAAVWLAVDELVRDILDFAAADVAGRRVQVDIEVDAVLDTIFFLVVFLIQHDKYLQVAVA